MALSLSWRAPPSHLLLASHLYTIKIHRTFKTRSAFERKIDSNCIRSAREGDETSVQRVARQNIDSAATDVVWLLLLLPVLSPSIALP